LLFKNNTSGVSVAQLKNIAIIAHVDHGKTTLVDQLLRQSGTLERRSQGVERVMDSNDLERERGITILAKNTAITWGDTRINIVDTPGHADFGGEVERILSMVDAVLLLVDAVEGPMPQTRFVTQKAFNYGLKPIVVINKVDRDGARPEWVVDQVFDLFDNLNATDEQLDFPVVYASALQGFSTLDLSESSDSMKPLLDLVVESVPSPDVDISGAFQMQVSSLDYSNYLGTIGIGRITRGSLTPNTSIRLISADGAERSGRILKLFRLMGVSREEIPRAEAGDIVAICGVDNLRISDTLCDPAQVEILPALVVDEPTVSMVFQVSNSPFVGREGKKVSSRQINERLKLELVKNVALRVASLDSADQFLVSGRGELHLSILIETMRREGFEFSVAKPQVVLKEVDGVRQEPFERVILDVDEGHQGAVMQQMSDRKGDLLNMVPDGKGRVQIDYMVPTRGLIGMHARFIQMTSGSGILYHSFDHFAPVKPGVIQSRNKGVLIANSQGKSTAFALWNLQERGTMLIGPQTEVYEGMVVGINSRDNDLVVNVVKGKQLTNVRASGTDDSIILTPAIKFSLEQALDFIAKDELLEVTPTMLRIRKRVLGESERKSLSRQKKGDG
jgi:GTP-binding protein